MSASSNMKSLAAVLAILRVVVLTACDGNGNETTESDSEPAARARFVAIGWQDGTIALDRLTIRYERSATLSLSLMLPLSALARRIRPSTRADRL